MVKEFVPEMRSDKKDAEIARLREQVRVLREQLATAVKEYEGLPHSLGYEFTHLPDMRAALAATKALVKEWACEKCRTVYPGPPQKGFMCVICPDCNGNTMPHEIGRAHV